jgi:hypothetical protein
VHNPHQQQTNQPHTRQQPTPNEAKKMTTYQLPPHASDAARLAVEKAISLGNNERAKAIASSPIARLSEELDPDLRGNLFQQRGDVVVVGKPNHRSTATALNEVHLELGAIRKVFLQLKRMVSTFWA